MVQNRPYNLTLACRTISASAELLVARGRDDLLVAGGVQNINMATLSAIPASKVVCTGDALKSCTMGQENQATIDVQSAGPGQSLDLALPEHSRYE